MNKDNNDKRNTDPQVIKDLRAAGYNVDGPNEEKPAIVAILESVGFKFVKKVEITVKPSDRNVI